MSGGSVVRERESKGASDETHPFVDVKAGFLSRSLIRHFYLALVASSSRAEICQVEFDHHETLAFFANSEKVEFEGAMSPLKFLLGICEKVPMSRLRIFHSE
jgi:hypothetical protein